MIGMRAFDALLEAKDRGWMKFVGVSADGSAAAVAAKRWNLDTQEFTYNVLFQESAENLMPTLRDRGMGTIIKRPIANGVYLRSERPDGSYMGDPWDRAQQMPLRELAGDMPLIEFALRFALSHEDVCTAIVGSTNGGSSRGECENFRWRSVTRRCIGQDEASFSVVVWVITEN